LFPEVRGLVVGLPACEEKWNAVDDGVLSPGEWEAGHVNLERVEYVGVNFAFELSGQTQQQRSSAIAKLANALKWRALPSHFLTLLYRVVAHCGCCLIGYRCVIKKRFGKRAKLD